MSWREGARALAIAARNVLIGCNLVSLRFIHQPRSLVAHANSNLFLWKTLADARRLPQTTIFEALHAQEHPVSLVLDSRWPLWFQPTAWFTADLVNLCLICQIVQPKVVFEIGTALGHAALHFALNTPPDSTIYTLDLPQDERATLRMTAMDGDFAERRNQELLFERDAAGCKVTKLWGDSATFDFSPYEGRVDLFFIDGAHSYEYVKNDTECALRCVRPGGVIAWHDYGRSGVNGVSKYLDGLAARHGRAIFSLVGSSVAVMRI